MLDRSHDGCDPILKLLQRAQPRRSLEAVPIFEAKTYGVAFADFQCPHRQSVMFAMSVMATSVTDVSNEDVHVGSDDDAGRMTLPGIQARAQQGGNLL